MRRLIGHVVYIVALVLTLAAPAGATSTIGTGDDAALVTDREGTTHVVWDIPQTNSYDLLGYCRIPRGSESCADTRTLTPRCSPAPGATEGIPAWKQDRAASGHGDGPEVQVTPFGDVVIVTHGMCPYPWPRSPDETESPWKNFTQVDRQIIFHSEDDGESFPDSEEGDARAAGSGGCDVCGGQPNVATDDRSASVYDASDSRVVTVQSSQRDCLNTWCSAGIYVLGTQPPPKQSISAITASRLTTDRTTEPPQLVQRGRGSFVALWWGSNGVFFRTFDCASCGLGAVSQASGWTPTTQIPSAGNPWRPHLVHGPAGTFVMYEIEAKTETGANGFALVVRKITGGSLGEPHTVFASRNAFDYGGSSSIVEDAATGRLIATGVFFPDDSANPPELQYTYSDDGGVTWKAPAKLVDVPRPGAGPPSTDIKQQLSVSTGDDGFTGVLLRNNVGPIFLDQLPGSGVTPPPSPPGEVGGGGGGTGGGPGATPPTDLPPLAVPPTPIVSGEGATDACKVKQFGPIDIKASVCLEIDKKSGAAIARGKVDVNGMTMAGKEIRFDAKARTITSDGDVLVSIGDTKLFKMPIDWQLPKGNTFTLPSLDIGALGGKLEGFPLKGSAEVKLVRGGVEIPIHVGLPTDLGGVTGDVTLRADNLSGIHLRELHVKAKLAPIGPLTLSNIEFTLNPDEHRWAGSATLALPPKPPGPVLQSDIGFTRGDLDYLRNELTFPGDGIPLDTANLTHLTKVRFGLETRPALKITGGVTLTAGPKFGDYRIAEVDGDFTFLFPNGQPAVLRADGKVKLLTIPVADAYVQYRTDGLISMGAGFNLDVIDIIQVNGRIEGWILPPKVFSIYGEAHLCVGDIGCGGGRVAVSSIGFAGCTDILGASVGVGYEWGPSILWAPSWIADLDVMVSGCSVGKYLPQAPGAAAAQAGAPTSITVEKDLPFTVFHVTGANAPPHVTLVDPAGRRIDAPADAPVKAADYVVLHAKPKNETIVMVKTPKAGRWIVEPAADSSPVIKAGHNVGLPEPSVKAKIGGKGRDRTLTYDIKPIDGQRVRFEEHGPGAKAGQSLGYAKGTKGTLKFTPAPGPKGKRRIVAFVESYKTPRAELNVASYTAPPRLKPGRPKQLRARRSGSRLVVTWAPSGKATRYVLNVALPDGRVVATLPKGSARRATIAGVPKKGRVRVAIKGQFSDGTTGPPARVALRR